MEDTKEPVVKLNNVDIKSSELEEMKKNPNIRIIQEGPESFRKLTRLQE